MDNKIVLGGYPIEGTVMDGDYLWFTGARWIPVAWGNEGEKVTLIVPPYKNIPFVSNGYVVIINNPQPGDVLSAVCASFTPGYGREQEYITNIPFISDRLKATDMTYDKIVDGGLDGGNLGALSVSSPTAATYIITVT